MFRRFRLLPALVLITFCLAVPFASQSAVVFKPKSESNYRHPGDEDMNGNAQQLFQTGQQREAQGDIKGALKAYRSLVRKYPRDALAAGSAFRYAQLEEKNGDYLRAADAYRVVVEKYPKSPNFAEAIEAQFRIGEMYLNGKKVKVFGIPIKVSMDRAMGIFAAIVRTAPYGKYTARAQFDIGLAAEKQGNAEAAVKAYTAVTEKFPDDPIAVDAQYQIGYLWFNSTRSGVRDAKATANAKIGFQDFLYKYPKSEKAAQAKENLRLLEQKQTTNSFSIAKFYDKQKNYRAAVIYYNDVIRQQPGSSASDQAKRRVDQLRAKVGEAALQPAALTAATAQKPKGSPPPGRTASEQPAMRTSPDDVAPLPPPEADESLPPPASLTPNTTTAPAEPSPTPTATPTPEQSPE
jgi:outer membrane protein assembly factor BamD